MSTTPIVSDGPVPVPYTLRTANDLYARLSTPLDRQHLLQLLIDCLRMTDDQDIQMLGGLSQMLAKVAREHELMNEGSEGT